MDEVMDCGCRYENRGVPGAKEFIPEIDCPIHGEQAALLREWIAMFEGLTNGDPSPELRGLIERSRTALDKWKEPSHA